MRGEVNFTGDGGCARTQIFGLKSDALSSLHSS